MVKLINDNEQLKDRLNRVNEDNSKHIAALSKVHNDRIEELTKKFTECDIIAREKFNKLKNTVQTDLLNSQNNNQYNNQYNNQNNKNNKIMNTPNSIIDGNSFNRPVVEKESKKKSVNDSKSDKSNKPNKSKSDKSNSNKSKSVKLATKPTESSTANKSNNSNK